MHWLLERLEEIGKSPTELARHLGVKKQRVYEIYTPNKKTNKTRRIQEGEWEPMASFLGWSVTELHARARGQLLAAHGTSVSFEGGAVVTDRPTATGLRFRSVRGKRGQWEGFMLHAIGASEDRPEAFQINVLDNKNEPTYRVRDRLIVDPNYPITAGEDCIFTSGSWPPTGDFCIIARLVEEADSGWVCRSLATGEIFELDRSEFPNAWAIVERRRPPLYP